VIISEKTFSADEDFTAMIKQNKAGVIIGTASGGSTGMNVYHELPGRGSFRLTIKKDPI
jgi:C-terminal processing protease CtpA/Prc